MKVWKYMLLSKVIIVYLLLYLMISCTYKTNVYKSNINGLDYSVRFKKYEAIIRLYNRTDSNLYLFATYYRDVNKMETAERCTQSRVLHRYDTITHEFNFSLLPLTQFLTYERFRNHFSKNRVIYFEGLDYDFQKISSGKHIEIKLPLVDACLKKYFIDKNIKDYYVTRMPDNSFTLNKYLEFDTIGAIPTDTVWLQFAIYKSLINLDKKAWDSLPNFNDYAINYMTLSIPLSLKRYLNGELRVSSIDYEHAPFILIRNEVDRDPIRICLDKPTDLKKIQLR